MHQGKLVFAQVMAHLPLSTFRRCAARHDGEHKVKSFSCLHQRGGPGCLNTERASISGALRV
jgi:hypothetical protein